MSGDAQSLEKVDETLQDIMGWGQYKAEAYRVLVAEGPLEAREIVVRTDIPQGRIYDVLDSLEREDGVIERRERNPARYRAQNPGRIITEKQDKFEEAKETLVTAHELNESESTSSTNSAWILGGQAGTVRKTRELMDTAESSIKGVERDPRWYRTEDMRTLRRLSDEGVNVQLMIWNPRQEQIEQFEDEGVSVHPHTGANKSFYVIDEEYVVMKSGQNETGIVFQDKSMASIFIREFDHLYDEAIEES
ncbi:TrmB family transcriptional regulator [Haloprofundus sp. MHR1]|uniref:TrmB family transcriptional regulator n=1 Tax=Haloprofundus sp. MHR1 TaxID=2572921 RepID=UPI0010BE6EED|nr:helix-turn-helix domain-containing protein [Haloprofundus sp. MHR1]QCJ47834.1 hypothetical protein FCF25_12215 [Haloprofundus sp. MHR1]